MKLPIFIKDESGCVEVYATIEDAINSMEAIDVNEGIYFGYDREGKHLVITTNKKDEIQLGESDIYEPDKLRKCLIYTFEHMPRFESKENLTKMNLEDLIIEFLRLKVISDNISIYGNMKRNILKLFRR